MAMIIHHQILILKIPGNSFIKMKPIKIPISPKSLTSTQPSFFTALSAHAKNIILCVNYFIIADLFLTITVIIPTRNRIGQTGIANKKNNPSNIGILNA